MRLVEYTKVCKGQCGRRLPVSSFSPAVCWPDGTPRYYASYCKPCKSAADAARIKERRKAPIVGDAIRKADRLRQRERYWDDPEWREERLVRQRVRQRRSPDIARPNAWVENRRKQQAAAPAPCVPAAPLFTWMKEHELSRAMVLERSGVGEWAYKEALRTGLISIDAVDRIISAFGFLESLDDLYGHVSLAA